jgi:hypothetical protein
VADREWLTHADFAGLVGEEFEVPDAGQVLRLVRADELEAPGGRGPDGRTRQQFSLLFHGPLASALEQGTVRMVSAGLGEQYVFLVPLGPDGDAMRYEAAFA